MNTKEVLAKLKLAFNDLMAPPAPPAPAAPPVVKLMDYNLKDGGTVTIDKLETGGIVMIDGNPALAGDIELEDGTKITVGDNGVISALTPGTPAPPADAPPAFNAEEKFTSLQTSFNEKITAYENKFAEYDKKMSGYEAKLGKANKVIEKLMELSTLIVEAPAAKPEGQHNNNFNNQELKYDPALFS